MSNEYINELLKLADNKFSVETDNMLYSEWISKNTTLKQRPFTFTRYPFQVAIANDWHPNMGVIKPSQIGLTEIQIRKALAFLYRNKGITMIMTFPDDDMRKRNSQTRIMPVLKDKVFTNAKNPGDKPLLSIELMQIGTSFLHITGSKESDATSTSADVLMSDEIDLTDQEKLALFSSRLQGSDLKINQQYSTPTYTGFGIDLVFGNSDQHHFLIKCDSCNHWQFPMFEPQFIEIPNLSSDLNDLLEIDTAMIDDRKLDLLNAYVCCEKCRTPLDLGRQDNREWVPKYPSRTLSRGYRANPFSVSTLSPAYIVGQLIKYKEKDFLRGFKNTVLGLPDDAGSARISEEDLNLCKGSMGVPSISKNCYHWVGIDVGQICNIVIGEGRNIEEIRVVEVMTCGIDVLNTKVKEIFERYNVKGGLIDRHPYEPTADAIRVQTQGIILPAEYRGDKEVNLVYNPEKEVIHVQVNRTLLLDEVQKGIRLHRLKINGYSIYWSVYVDHLRNMVREEEPETPAIWKKLNNNDHFFHATGFMLSAIKAKDLELLKEDSDPRATVLVATANLQGYNANINGNKLKTGNSIWNR